ncbi:MAG: hypothetical protein JHD16_04700 [Solirubrobacteraceae bacterium]|nr:hypothetical protein [Solirubrobacteraceae bacterium]
MVGHGPAAGRSSAVAAAPIAPHTRAAIVGAAVDPAALDAVGRARVVLAPIRTAAHAPVARGAVIADFQVGDAARGSTFSRRTRQEARWDGDREEGWKTRKVMRAI